MSKVYNYCGTSHTHMLDEFAGNAPYWCQYVYAAQEWGTELKKEHVQFVCQSTMTAKKIGKAYGYHVELMRGTKDQAIAYCQKDKGRKFEFGEWKDNGQGCRNDLVQISQMIKDGKSLSDIEDKYPSQYMRMARYIEDAYYRNLRRSRPQCRAAPRKVIFVTGPTGSGKTRTVFSMCNDKAYRLANQDNTMWWKGYEGEDIVILDDYKGGMRLNTLLGILDPWYNTDVSVAPSQLVRCAASTIYITSTLSPQEWYPGQDVSELLRRITQTINVVT